MTTSPALSDALKRCPLVAILRGIMPDESEPVGQALLDSGLTIIEVPLNSPHPYETIRRLSDLAAGKALIGAGTVLTANEVDQVRAAGGRLIVSPNANAAVIRHTLEAGMVSIPGALSPTEAFAAIDAGAHAIKLFPADIIGLAGLRAMRAVLPSTVSVLAVGGIDASNAEKWLLAGAAGVGVGSSLYQPNLQSHVVKSAAEILISAISATDRGQAE